MRRSRQPFKCDLTHDHIRGHYPFHNPALRATPDAASAGRIGDMSKHSYHATFDEGRLSGGKVACPSCGGSALHPTGHATPIYRDMEYSPEVSVTAWCECGQTVAIELGNYKGQLGIDVVPLGPLMR